jgi:hypothetical protein
MSSIDALWSELKEEEHRLRRTPKGTAGIPSFSTHLAAPPDNATIATAGIAGMPQFCSYFLFAAVNFILQRLL